MADKLNRIVDLLGASCSCSSEATEQGLQQHQQLMLESNQKRSALVDELGSCLSSSASASLPDEGEASCSFPCLSLASDVGAASSSRSAIKTHAAALMSRSLKVGFDDRSHVESLPQTLLENVYSSFDTLVDARIRVYTRVLRTHGRSLAESNQDERHSLGAKAINYKLKTLVEIGTSLSADAVSTNFKFLGGATITDDESDGSIQTNTTTTRTPTTKITAPIQFEASITSLRIGNHKVSLSFRTLGSVTGTFSKQNFRLESIHVDVDTDALLSNMMAEATKVVSILVDVTNQVWSNFVLNNVVVPYNNDEDQQSGGGLVAAAAAPQHQDTSKNTFVSNKLNAAGITSVVTCNNLHAAVPVVDTTSAVDAQETKDGARVCVDASSTESISSLVSEESEFDAEKCANIVDFVMGEIDEQVLVSPPIKKRKLVQL